jgi:hypothetical protein
VELTYIKNIGSGQVWVILPENLDDHLAHVEWFSRFPVPDPDHGMLRLNRVLDGEDCVANIVPDAVCAFKFFQSLGKRSQRVGHQPTCWKSVLPFTLTDFRMYYYLDNL